MGTPRLLRHLCEFEVAAQIGCCRIEDQRSGRKLRNRLPETVEAPGYTLLALVRKDCRAKLFDTGAFSLSDYLAWHLPQ
jgi:hypothetical protein